MRLTSVSVIVSVLLMQAGQALAQRAAGATRLGTSSGVALVQGAVAGAGY